MDITNILVEGGGELLGSMFDSRLVDRAVFFYAPIIIGGRDAVPAVGGAGVARIAHALRLQTEPMVVEAKVRQ
jgi:diaminohydroxyphosphoribosylaminopyrimidine deaminase/5-amino-6-(5-phosphoribosylamino)uracil reductase